VFVATIALASISQKNCIVYAFSLLPPSFLPRIASCSNGHSDTFYLSAHPGGHPGSSTEATTVDQSPPGFIETELRGAAMKLHTRMQSPKEGQAEEKVERVPYITTHSDYLHFLVDSQHVYQTFEDKILPEMQPELQSFLNTGLERTDRLEKDIAFVSKEYGSVRPEVGEKGLQYATELRRIAEMGKDGIPELMCHYYNFYFAHTAGGRMIGKSMAKSLLDNKTLEFYKWDGSISKIKKQVKINIEELVKTWTQEQKDQCVSGTAAAFTGGGGLNSYLGGSNPH